MALENTRALNIICKIGGMDISRSNIDSFEIERNCSDLANKFTMTLVDTPDIPTITYDLEMYMAGGYRDIDISYGDLEVNEFTKMKGTIYNYSYNFVGNIKNLTISGICSAFIYTDIVGSITYNIDWNSYINQRVDETKPWNFQQIQNVTASLDGHSWTTSASGDTTSSDNLKSSYILLADYRKAITYNSKMMTIKSPINSNSIQIPIPELFIKCTAPMEFLTDPSLYSGGDGKIDPAKYKDLLSKLQDKTNPDYYKNGIYLPFCSMMNDYMFWGSLTPYMLKTEVEDAPPMINTSHRAYKDRESGTIIGYGQFWGNKTEQLTGSGIYKCSGYDDHGNSIYFYLNAGSGVSMYWSSYYDGAGGYGGILLSLLTTPGSPFYNYSPMELSQKTYDNYVTNSMFGQIKTTTVNGHTYWVKSDGRIISLDVDTSYGTDIKTMLQHSFFDLSAMNDQTLYHKLNATIQDPRFMVMESHEAVEIIPGYSISDICWKDSSNNIRAFYISDNSGNSEIFIQAKPETESYKSATFFNSGVGVNPADIVSKLAVLEGWNTKDNKFIVQTATLENSETFIMNNSTAIDFITEKLIPNSVLAAGMYKSTSGKNIYMTQALAGYSLWFDSNDILHYHPISNAEFSNLSLEIGYNYPNSPVLTFSVNTKGTAFYTQASKQISTLSLITGQEVTSISGLTSNDSYVVSKSNKHNAFMDQWYGTTYQEVEDKGFTESKQVEAFYNSIISRSYVTSIVKSSTSGETEIKSNMNNALENIKDFTITGTMTLIGNSKIKPFSNLTIINMVKGSGYNAYSNGKFSKQSYASNEPVIHPSSGIYLILSQTDKFSASAGFVQELNLIRQTENLEKLTDNDIDYGIKAVWWTTASHKIPSNLLTN